MKMRRARVMVGSETGRGATLIMSRGGTSTAEMVRASDIPTTTIDEAADFYPVEDEPPRVLTRMVGRPIPTTPIVDLAPRAPTTQPPVRLPSVGAQPPSAGYLLARTPRSDTTTPETFGSTSPPPINKVTDRLYIGNHIAAKDPRYLTPNGITHIVNTTAEVANYHASSTDGGGGKPAGYHYLRLGLFDHPEQGKEDLIMVLEPSYRYISNVLRKPGTNVLVHCHAGISRSASIVIYYLMRSRGWGYDRALSYLRDIRPIVRPNDWYERQLRDVERLLAR